MTKLVSALRRALSTMMLLSLIVAIFRVCVEAGLDVRKLLRGGLSLPVTGDEAGSVTVLTAFSLIPLLGFLGLAIDVGMLHIAKEQLQAAADAAALAAALEISSCGGTSACAAMTVAAQSALAENSLSGSQVRTNCQSGAIAILTITVNNGPCALGSSNPHNGKANYVEVVVARQVPTYFASVLGFTSVPINARAEASSGGSTVCILMLASTGGSTFNLNATLSASNCSIFDNSSDNLAMNLNGPLTAGSIGTVGSYQANYSVSPTPKTGQAAVADPLASLPVPSYTAASCLPQTTSTQPVGPPSAAGQICYNGMVLNGNVTLSPGLYIINSGNFNYSGSGTLTANGVTFYLAPGTNFTQNGNGTVRMTAPTTGSYNGVLIFQARTNSHTIIFQVPSALTLQGIIYGPAAQLIIQNGQPASIAVDVITASANFSQSLSLSDYSTINSESPLGGGGADISQ